MLAQTIESAQRREDIPVSILHFTRRNGAEGFAQGGQGGARWRGQPYVNTASPDAHSQKRWNTSAFMAMLSNHERRAR